MPGKKFPLSVVIEAVDKLSAPMRRINQEINNTFVPVRKLGLSLKTLGQESGLERLGRSAMGVKTAVGGVATEVGKLGAGLVALGYVFNRTFVNTAAEFERYGTILETIEGSREKAKTSLDWVSDFAAKTPYALQEVLDGFVKLRAYGMEPTNGLLKSLGDTSSAMGKSLSSAVEAIADAVTGENERLKEFGIKARKDGNRIAYEYTLGGKTMVKVARANSREMIQATLEGIFNAKYAGAMDAQSKTWNGMVSNLGDQWTRFVNMVMGAGVFDWLKTSLGQVLDRVNAMAASGELKALAETIGTNLVAGLRDLKDIGLGAFRVLKGMHDLFGSWKPLIIGVGLVLAGPLLASVVALGVAVGGLVVAFGSIAGVVAVGVGALAGLVVAFGGVERVLYRIGKGINDYLVQPVSWLAGKMGLLGGEAAAALGGPAGARGVPAGAAGLPVSQNITRTNNAAVSVSFDNVPQGARVRQVSGTAPLTLNMGRMMAG